MCDTPTAQQLTATRLQRAFQLSTSDASDRARRLAEVEEHSITRADIRTALLAFASARLTAGPSPDPVEVVCTSPDRFGLPIRTTFATACDMIRTAKDEIVVVGYVFTAGAAMLVGELVEARRARNIRILVIGNDMPANRATLRASWPNAVPPPTLYSRPPNETDPMSALHAKFLLCDRSNALVTSANFSFHGLHGNIEVGIRVSSPVVERLADFVFRLINTGTVEPLAWS